MADSLIRTAVIWSQRPPNTLAELIFGSTNPQEVRNLLLPPGNPLPTSLPNLPVKYIPTTISFDELLKLPMKTVIDIFPDLPDPLRAQISQVFHIEPKTSQTLVEPDAIQQPMIQKLDATAIDAGITATQSTGLIDKIFAGRNRLSAIGPDGMFYSVRKCETYKVKDHALSNSSLMFELRFDLSNMIAWISPPTDAAKTPADFVNTLNRAFNQFYRNLTNSDDAIPVSTLVSKATQAVVDINLSKPIATADGLKRARRPPKSITAKKLKQNKDAPIPVVSLPSGSFGGIVDPIYFPIEYDNWIVLTNDEVSKIPKAIGCDIPPFLSPVPAPNGFLEYFGKTPQSTHTAYAVDTDEIRRFYINDRDSYITTLKMFTDRRRGTIFSAMLDNA